MSHAKNMAIMQRAEQNDPSMTPEERLEALREEVRELQQPQGIDLGDGVNAVLGATAGALLTNHFIKNSGLSGTQKLIATIGASFVAAAVTTLAGRKVEADYVEARISSAYNELTNASLEVMHQDIRDLKQDVGFVERTNAILHRKNEISLEYLGSEIRDLKGANAASHGYQQELAERTFKHTHPAAGHAATEKPHGIGNTNVIDTQVELNQQHHR
jgi:hypothetical protein